MMLRFLTSSVGRKYLMAATGMAWYLFVLTHMLANMLILFDANAYNKYSHALISNPLIYVAEGGLVLMLLTHTFTGISLFLRNAKSKPQKYAVVPSRVKGASLASKTMIFTGSITLFFVVTHLITFKYGPWYTTVIDGVEMRDLHRLVLEVFQSPGYVVGYIVALGLLALHLFHGISSSFQTFGVSHPRWNASLKAFGILYSVTVTLGFLSQPLYVFLIAR